MGSSRDIYKYLIVFGFKIIIKCLRFNTKTVYIFSFISIMKRDYFVQYALFFFGLVAPFISLGLEDTYLHSIYFRDEK